MNNNILITPESIFDLLVLDNFRKRPGMYLSQPSISILYGFITGYFYTNKLNGIEREKEERFYSFSSWVANYYSWYEPTAGWRRIILDECKGDEEAAFVTFFELYDKFLDSF